jgi:hypothetical protein
MSAELILAIASLCLSTFIRVLTVILNAKVGRLEHLEAEHKYKKHRTKFELSFKDEEWLFNLMQSDEFHNYDNKSRRLIHKWWREYSNTYLPEKLKATLPNSHDFSGVILRCPLPVEVPVEDGPESKKED